MRLLALEYCGSVMSLVVLNHHHVLLEVSMNKLFNVETELVDLVEMTSVE